MSAPWKYAIRSAARRVPRTPVATQASRCFHSSVPIRAPTSTPGRHGPNNGPGSGRNKPEKDDDSDNETKEEKLFGEDGLNGNGEEYGRRPRRSNGSVRSRTMRSRTPDELPPLQLPDDFQEKHVWRPGVPRESPLRRESLPKENLDVLTRDYLAVKDKLGDKLAAPSLKIFDALAWNDADVQTAREDMEAGRLAHIAERGAVALMALTSATISATASLHDSNSPDATVKESLSSLLVKAARVKEGRFTTPRFLGLLQLAQHADRPGSDRGPQELRRVLRRALRSDLSFISKGLGPLHYEVLQEAMSSIRADFSIEPPKSIKVTDLRRPVTVLNFPYYSGFKWPKHVIEHIAGEIEADVIHLTGYDLARYVGSYLGEDVTRAAGPLSLLGYRAAENSGRIRQQRLTEEEDDQGTLKMPLSIVLSTGKAKQEPKRGMSLSQLLMGESHSNRGKSDEMWQDMKLNAALEELIHVADCEASEQHPLIVHIHDFQAISMDADCGAMIINKFRRIVDSMWCEGRKVVLVGTCSSLDAPSTYMSALEELESVERVLTLNTVHRRGNAAINDLSKKEFLDENTTNIRTMVETLLKPSCHDKLPDTKFSLQKMSSDDLPASLSKPFAVLPLTAVYRIAHTMIGLRGQQSEAFDQSLFEEAVHMIQRIDGARERSLKSKETGDRPSRMSEGIMANMRKLDPRYENHEEKLMSGLVNSKDIRTTFDDVHAPKETIESVKMLTQLSLLRPEAFSYGVLATDRIPGCLLYGPPGTGKTLLAKAVAKESGANMIEVSGASINNMWVGESEKNVKALFSLAKKKEPMVIFIDEADALLGSRGERNAGARRETINQFLREWDGMDSMKAFIMVATNRPFDLDEAVLRRLPRKLLIDLPLEEDRAAILKIHLKDEVVDETVSIEKIAKNTPLYSGSDLKNVCVAAAMAAVKEELEASERHTGPEPYVWSGKRILNRRHFDKALAEISASINEDMQSLTAIRKFDEKYGDARAKRNRRRGMGFEVGPQPLDAHQARVRK